MFLTFKWIIAQSNFQCHERKHCLHGVGFNIIRCQGRAMLFTLSCRWNGPINRNQMMMMMMTMREYVQPRSYLAVVHLGLHDALHVFLLHGWWHPKAVPHTQDLCPALGVRHLHRTVQDHRPRVQLEPKHMITVVRCWKKNREHEKKTNKTWGRKKKCYNNNNFVDQIKFSIVLFPTAGVP